jgi:hypothetical protein
LDNDEASSCGRERVRERTREGKEIAMEQYGALIVATVRRAELAAEAAASRSAAARSDAPPSASATDRRVRSRRIATA